ncbi:2'-5' RNA ligase family protein [Hymenobacter cellulosivorans]|uniref:2'-5' RNA ligase family protein n=1 Tax=Hymenobacter cellulosivorans TaxID=2932249 RepID=A0ABY4F3B0_9BACT|nr:2'-5' RNA ligase family protein [Hymenobacter cellulosivorans]UOQ51145.1 2'-5' RNA ligase family protein [Hymenobacter cellulosivorans]
MNLPDYYAAMRQAAFLQLGQGQAELDPLLHSAATDTRRGLTLLARPPAAVAAAIEAVLADFRQIEPDQYYYPVSDLHLTVLSIISCYSGFTLDLINPADYQQAVRRIVESAKPFTIRFAGLTASPGAIIVQGFMVDEGLSELRNQVRAFFRHSELQQSIDQRYSIQTAHATVARFTTPLRDPARLMEKIRQYEHCFFGDFEVQDLELVYNDWYQRAGNTVLLEKYSLG